VNGAVLSAEKHLPVALVERGVEAEKNQSNRSSGRNAERVETAHAPGKLQ
jgi:hypothetical protein